MIQKDLWRSSVQTAHLSPASHEPVVLFQGFGVGWCHWVLVRFCF